MDGYGSAGGGHAEKDDIAVTMIVKSAFGELKYMGKELSEMKDTEKLYAYTSGIMGVLALIAAVISILL